MTFGIETILKAAGFNGEFERLKRTGGGRICITIDKNRIIFQFTHSVKCETLESAQFTEEFARLKTEGFGEISIEPANDGRMDFCYTRSVLVKT